MTLTIKEGIGLTWTGYSDNSPQVGDTVTLQTPTVTLTGSGSATTDYAVHTTTTNSSCTVVAGTGALTIAHAGTCVIQLTVTASGYATEKLTRTITIAKGDQAAPTWAQPNNFYHHFGPRWSRYTGIHIGNDYLLKANTAPSGGGGHGHISFSSETGTVCSASRVGWLGYSDPHLRIAATMNALGTCTICAKWAGNSDYNPSPCASLSVEVVKPLVMTGGSYTASNGIEVTGVIPNSLINTGVFRLGSNYTYTMPTITDPVNGANVTHSFRADEEYSDAGRVGCMVNSSNGTLTPSRANIVPAGVSDGSENFDYFDTNCEIEHTMSAPGYSSVTRTYEIAIIGANYIYHGGWGTYSGDNSANLSEGTLNAPGLTALFPADAVKAYSRPDADSGVCSVHATSGVVTLNGEGTCRVTLRLSKASYTTRNKTYTIQVTLNTIAVGSWGSYPAGPVRQGTSIDAATLTGLNPADVTKAYATTSGSTGCTVHPTSGAVTVTGTGDCQIQLTLSKDNSYRTRTNTYDSFTVLASNKIYVPASGWGYYPGGDSTTRAPVEKFDTIDAPSLTGVLPAGVARTYTSLTTSVCSVDSNGQVTGKLKGDCNIQLSLSKTGFAPETHTYELVVNNLTMGTITAPIYIIAPEDINTRAYNAHDDGPPNYNRFNNVNVVVPLGLGPRGMPEGSTVTYQIHGWLDGSQRLNSGQEEWSTTSIGGDCSINTNTGKLTFVWNSGFPGGLGGFLQCGVRARITHPDYNDGYSEVAIIHQHVNHFLGSVSLTSWGGLYDIPRIGGGAVSAPTLTGMSPVDAEVIYSLGAGSTGCTVDATTGAVTATAATTNCKVVATLYKGARWHNLQHTYNLMVPVSASHIGIHAGTYSDTYVGQAYRVDAPAVLTDPADARKTYSTTSDACSVDSNGQVTGDAAGDCVITLRLTKQGLIANNYTFPTFEILALRSFTGLTWTGYDSSSVDYRADAPSLSNPRANPDPDSWSYTTSTPTVCSVNPTSGALTISRGERVR